MKVNEFHKQIRYLYRLNWKIGIRNRTNKPINLTKTQKKVEGKVPPPGIWQNLETTLKTAAFGPFFADDLATV